jgi:hypothetical protein
MTVTSLCAAAAGGATIQERILRHKAPDAAALLVIFQVDVLSMTAVRCLLTVLCAAAAGGATIWERILRHTAPDAAALSEYCVVTGWFASSAAFLND